MKSLDELKGDLVLAKTDEAYHRKKMEYYKESIPIMEAYLKNLKGVDKKDKKDLAQAKIKEISHKKDMEYQQEQIDIIEEQIKNCKPFANKDTIFTRSGKCTISKNQTLGRLNRPDNKLTEVVKCQNCGKNNVVIMKNHAYFGIICSECSKSNCVYTTKGAK